MTVDVENDKGKKVYGFDEAINLTGVGWYNVALMASLSLSLLAMCIDMFSFSVVVQLSSCDFQLNSTQKSVLVSMPFLGPVLTAYIWGYVSDMKGRRLTLILGMVVSFVFSTLCAFSSHWIVIGILKLISTCFCSCAQSATFTLLGESCPEEKKSKYLIVLSSVMHLGLSIYFVLSYLIGHLTFSYDLGLITFVPWRLLVIALALPLGLSAVSLIYFYESPKFLLNAGREQEALDALRGIRKINCGDSEYPVEKVILKEQGNINTKDMPLLQSLKDQTLPLFKPPLLFNTLLLYFFITIVYSSSGSLYIWLPFLANAFASSSAADFTNGLCGVITKNNSINNSSGAEITCRPFELPVVIAGIISGSTYSILNFLMSKLANRRRMLIIIIFVGASVFSFLNTVIPNQAAVIAYMGVMSTSLAMGPLFSYYVSLYPTSFRGMATCLGVMVARISSVLGINIVGVYITSHCTYTFYALSFMLLVGGVGSLLLPPDKPNTK